MQGAFDAATTGAALVAARLDTSRLGGWGTSSKDSCVYHADMEERPKHLDLDKDRGLSITWPNGRVSFYPIAYLRRMSPSADMRELRAEQDRNPLMVLPDSMANVDSENLHATDAELVGNYAIRIHFSDGHHTGIYSWAYLRQIDPEAPE